MHATPTKPIILITGASGKLGRALTSSLQGSYTIVEDEFKSEERLSAPARIRRVLSRFLVVVIVSLAIECLVATFQYVHDEPAMLAQAATIALGAAALLIAWGVFLRLSRVEPE